MFGVVRPCRHRLCAPLHQAWMSHLCGLCLALRDEHGHACRVATNYDGLLISVLTQAQAPAGTPLRRAAPCALRGFRSAEVLDASGEGTRLAAAVSLLLAAGKTRDHVEDADGAYGVRPVASVAARVAERFERAGTATAAGLAFDVGQLTAAVGRQAVLEEESSRLLSHGPSLLELTAPTEVAVAAAFGHTAVLAGRPGNRDALRDAGRCFGRLAHLIDAVEDLDADRAAGRYNPLLATGTSREQARSHCDDAVRGLEAALSRARFADDALVAVLLGPEVHRAVQHAFHVCDPPAATAGRLSLLSKHKSRRKHRRSHGSDGADFSTCCCCECCACECCGCCDC